MALGLRARVNLGIGIVFTILLIMGAASLASLWQLEGEKESLTHTERVRTAIAELMRLLADAESSQRGFIVTGDSAYLRPYALAVATADARLRELEQLVADEPSLQERLPDLSRLVDARLTRLDATLAVSRAEGFAAARVAIRLKTGFALMDSIRGVLGAMEREEVRLLAPRRRAADVASRRTWAVVLTGSLLAAIAAVAGGLLAHRDIGRRLAAQRDARNREAWIRAVLNTAPDAILVVGDDGKLRGINPACVRIFGWSEPEADGLEVSRLFPLVWPAAAGSVPSGDTPLADLLGRTAELVGQRRDGTSFPAELTINELVLEAGERLFVGVARDLTEQRRLVAEREQSHQRYMSAAGVMAEGIVVQDAAGTVVDCNPAAELILGLPREQVLRLADQNWEWHGLYEDGRPFPKDDHPALRVMRTGLPVRNVVMGVRRRTGTRWLLINSAPMRGAGGAVTGVVSSFTDITRRKEAEQQLRSTSLFQRAVLDGANASIIATDPDGLIVTYNRTAEEWLGWPAGEMVGRRTPAAIHDSAEVAQRAEELTRASGTTVEPGFECLVYEARRGGTTLRAWTYVRRDGTRFPVLLGVTALRDDHGAITGFLGVATDITEQHAAEAALARARDAAQQANRAKSEFLANMSHELRTPLNSVIGFANVLLKNRGGNLSAQDLQFLSRIEDNGRHLLGLINSILDLSKIEAGRMELDLTDVALEALVRETLAQLEGQLQGRPIALVCDAPPRLLPLRTDDVKLKQVLINLASNAIKFTEKGSVTVRIAADERGLPVRLDVIDTGVGIPADRIETVFEAFRQADSSTARRYGGTGLGLTITRSLLHLLGCSITVTSTEGGGSTFSVHLAPSAGGPTGIAGLARPAAPEPPLPTSAGPRARPLVLIIDDDPDARMLLVQFVNDFGADAVEAGSGARGLVLARALRPALITLDIMMPHMNGLEVLNALKRDAELEPIPVAIVSIVGSEKRERALNAVAIIDKPVSREELEAVLGAHLPPRETTELRDELGRLVRRYGGAGDA